jgi:hypothetical protein
LLHVLPKPSTLNLNVVDCNASVIVTVARRSSISVSGGLGYPPPAGGNREMVFRGLPRASGNFTENAVSPLLLRARGQLG